jgi:hypothetical protein
MVLQYHPSEYHGIPQHTLDPEGALKGIFLPEFTVGAQEENVLWQIFWAASSGKVFVPNHHSTSPPPPPDSSTIEVSMVLQDHPRSSASKHHCRTPLTLSCL